MFLEIKNDMTSNKKKKGEKKNPKKESISQPKIVEEDKPEGFDFGGLPLRDLKKNLGCG
jgi:hypothetical protein